MTAAFLQEIASLRSALTTYRALHRQCAVGARDTRCVPCRAADVELAVQPGARARAAMLGVPR